MSILGRALIFVVKEVTQPALENLGKHLGDAVGTVLGRKIQPDHEDGDSDEDEQDETSEDDDDTEDDVDEDERTP